MLGVMQSLTVEICADPDDAIRKGYDANDKYKGAKPVSVSRVVVIKRGTMAGASTADFLMQDEAGNKYLFMVTGSLLKSLPV